MRYTNVNKKCELSMPQERELRLHEQGNVLSRLELRRGVWKWKDENGAAVHEIPYIKCYM